MNQIFQLSLTELLHFRWAVPILASLGDLGGGAKLFTLQSRLGANRTSIQRTLKALMERDLVARNPGYGHPMRPEYLLTNRGRKVAPFCQSLIEGLDLLDLTSVGLKKWSLPVIEALPRSEGRFNRLRSELPGITARALAQSLKDLLKAELVVRDLVDDHPPRSVYHLTDQGRRLGVLVSVFAPRFGTP